jgi:hypothetical protein
MRHGPMKKKDQQTLISVLISLALMTGLLVLLVLTGQLFTVNADERIAAAAKQLLAFRSDLKGDDIQVQSQDGAITLTGTVAAEPHLFVAADAVADLPGVKRVDNRLEIRTAAGPGRGASAAAISAPGLRQVTK